MSIKQVLSNPLPLSLRQLPVVLGPAANRKFATTLRYYSYTQPPIATSENPRWLSDTKDRIGRLFFHGATPEESREAGEILSLLTNNWREYIAGSEGFLTGETRRGLFRHNVVWGDMDSMGNTACHVNNVTYTRWAESARVNWAWNFAKHVDPVNRNLWAELCSSRGVGLILKSIQVDYKLPIEWPDKVTVYHKLSEVGDSSFTLGVIILSEKHQRLAARCMEDIVVYNYKPKGTSPPGRAPLPEFVRIQFESTLQLQKEARDDALSGIRDIDARVNGLEMKVLSRKEMT
ncbi:thioesterase-like superfamily-domain-containing protein [Tuber indicum]|nr:thioesterase-like superfamily-domain-containing protein [Tuber indicum]